MEDFRFTHLDKQTISDRLSLFGIEINKRITTGLQVERNDALIALVGLGKALKIDQGMELIKVWINHDAAHPEIMVVIADHLIKQYKPLTLVVYMPLQDDVFKKLAATAGWLAKGRTSYQGKTYQRYTYEVTK